MPESHQFKTQEIPRYRPDGPSAVKLDKAKFTQHKEPKEHFPNSLILDKTSVTVRGICVSSSTSSSKRVT
jgi:hypothetical protein